MVQHLILHLQYKLFDTPYVSIGSRLTKNIVSIEFVFYTLPLFYWTKCFQKFRHISIKSSVSLYGLNLFLNPSTYFYWTKCVQTGPTFSHFSKDSSVSLNKWIPPAEVIKVQSYDRQINQHTLSTLWNRMTSLITSHFPFLFHSMTEYFALLKS